MLRKFDPLPVITCDHKHVYAHPPSLPEVSFLDDSALTVMFDMQTHNAVTIDKDKCLAAAKDELDMMHVTTLLVVNEKDELIGLISAADIMGNKSFIESEKKRIPRGELKVEEIMTPYNQLLVLDYQDVKVAEVSNIAVTISQHKVEYAIVVDREKDQVRGLFTHHHLNQALGYDIFEKIDACNSLAELSEQLKEA